MIYAPLPPSANIIQCVRLPHHSLVKFTPIPLCQCDNLRKQYNNWINYSTPSHQGFDKFVHELETNELKQTPCLNRNSLYSQL